MYSSVGNAADGRYGGAASYGGGYEGGSGSVQSNSVGGDGGDEDGCGASFNSVGSYGAPPPGVSPATTRVAKNGGGHPPPFQMHHSHLASVSGEELRQTADVFSSLILLKLQATGLTGRRKPLDSFCVVYLRSYGLHEWKEAGRTDTEPASDSPSYRLAVPVVFHFGFYQQLRLVVFDRRSSSEDIDAHEVIGAADVNLGSILGAPPGRPFEVQLVNVKSQRPPGRLTIHVDLSFDSSEDDIALTFGTTGLVAEELEAEDEEVELQASMHKLSMRTIKKVTAQKKERVMSRMRSHGTQAAARPGAMIFPRLVVRRSPLSSAVPPEPGSTGMGAGLKDLESSDRFQLVHVTEIIDNYDDSYYQSKVQGDEDYISAPPEDVNGDGGGSGGRHGSASFPTVKIGGARLTGGDERRLFELAVYSSDEKIGSIVTSITALKTLTPGDVLPLEPQGFLIFEDLRINRQAPFVEILRRRDVALSLMVAMDFTSSNGDPRREGSLHYMSPVRPSIYELTCRSLANVLLQHCESKDIPAYGFGAQQAPTWDTSHCFPLGDNSGDYVAHGIEALIDKYRTSVINVKLYGPTVLTEVLRTAEAILSRGFVPGRPCPYLVLVVLTDGNVSDEHSLIEHLVHISYLPLSLVLVGLGEDNFAKMSVYSGDAPTPLKSGNKVAARRNTHLVTYKAFDGNLSKLVSHALSKIPEQVCSFVRLASSPPS